MFFYASLPCYIFAIYGIAIFQMHCVESDHIICITHIVLCCLVLELCAEILWSVNRIVRDSLFKRFYWVDFDGNNNVCKIIYRENFEYVIFIVLHSFDNEIYYISIRRPTRLWKINLIKNIMADFRWDLHCCIFKYSFNALYIVHTFPNAILNDELKDLHLNSLKFSYISEDIKSPGY